MTTRKRSPQNQRLVEEVAALRSALSHARNDWDGLLEERNAARADAARAQEAEKAALAANKTLHKVIRGLCLSFSQVPL